MRKYTTDFSSNELNFRYGSGMHRLSLRLLALVAFMAKFISRQLHLLSRGP